jgi:hypothetical protein
MAASGDHPLARLGLAAGHHMRLSRPSLVSSAVADLDSLFQRPATLLVERYEDAWIHASIVFQDLFGLAVESIKYQAHYAVGLRLGQTHGF